MLTSQGSPILASYFTGRVNEIEDLTIALLTQRARPIFAALCGIAGIGKTQMAIEYINQFGHQYESVVWLNASSRETLRLEVSALVQRLALRSMNVDDPFTLLKCWLQTQENWLLILDDCSDLMCLEQIVPVTGYFSAASWEHVLITTRQQAAGTTISTAISLGPLSEEEGVSFLLRRAGYFPKIPVNQVPSETFDQAAAIVRTMDGLPLALDQAGAYLYTTGESLLAYLDRFMKEPKVLLRQRGVLNQSHPASVLTTLTHEFSAIAHHRKSRDILHLLAFFPFEWQSSELFVRFLCKDQMEFDEAIRVLRQHSLILREKAIRLPRIVQITLRATLTTSQQRFWASKVVLLVNRAFPEVVFTTWKECERYLSQAQYCATLLTDFQLMLPEGASLLQRVGFYCLHQASYVEANRLLAQALDMYEQLQGNPLDIARTLNALGLVYYHQARYTEAEVTLIRALDFREQTLGSNDLQTAESLHNLALVYGIQERYTEAERLYQRVLSIEERALGPDHSDTARTLSNLGLVYFKQGNFAQAEAAYQHARSIYARSLIANHPDHMYPLDGLGAIAEEKGDFQQAKTYYQQVLAIAEEAFGQNHPEIAHSLNKLADIAEVEGEDQHAEKLYQRALSISEQALGREHPDIALFLNNLAFLTEKQGNTQLAENYYQRSLAIYEQTLGMEHAMVADVLTNLALLFCRNNTDGARVVPFLQRALDIRERVFGPTHPQTIKSRANLEKCQ